MTITYPWNDESDFHTPQSQFGEFIAVTPEGEVFFLPENTVIVTVSEMSQAEKNEAVTLISKPAEVRHEWAAKARGAAWGRNGQ